MLVEILLILVTVVVTVLLYSKHRHSYWSSIGIPSAPALPLIGDFHKNFLLRMWTFHDQMYQKYAGSKLYGRYECLSPVLVVVDPDMLKDILVKDFDHFTDRRFMEGDEIMQEMLSTKRGDEWKALRSVLTPTFSSGKMKVMFPLVCEKADALVSACINDAAKDPAIEIKDKCGRFTMDTIASVAFGIECNSFGKEKPEFATKAEAFFTVGLKDGLKILLSFILPKLAKILKLETFKEMKFFCNAAKEIIQSRKDSHVKRGDFLDLLLEARAENNDSSTTSTKQILSDISIVAQSASFLIGGYDTTASTLSFASQLLAINPKEQHRLREELQNIIKQEGELNYNAIMESKLLDACIQETLRLCPPAIVGERVCTKPYKIHGTEVKVNPGNVVQIPFWSIHRDPNHWPDPLEFRPDRFMPENKANIKPFTHMPFGMGPRNCIAMRFALMEVKIGLAKLLLAAQLEVAEGYEEIVFDDKSFMLRPPHDTKVILKPFESVSSCAS